ncbi:MAG: DUF1800 domain-containing protein [Vulcanimicrobiaceae bacterium]
MNAADTAPYRPLGNLALPNDLAPYRGPWNARLAAHLLRRAGFGGSPRDVAKLAAQPSADAAVASLLAFPTRDPLPPGPAYSDDPSAAFATLRERVRGDLASLREQIAGFPLAPGAARAALAADPEIKELRKATRQVEFRAAIQARLWWLDRMLHTPAPLQEKLTLFWHGHFTSTVLQKGVTTEEIVAQNQFFRRYALGNVRELTAAVAYDPAMLKYLDNIHNEKAHANENFARELMELYTLGLGAYAEEDVRQAARAWTGIRMQPQGGQVYLDANLHDQGQKTILGQTGNWDGHDVVRIIFAQPAAARFFAERVLEAFVYSQPEPELVAAVGEALRAHDFELAPVLGMLLRSNLFYSPRAYRALVRSPIDFVIGTYQLAGIDAIPPQTLGALARMGQVLFSPPNVRGWPGGAAWLNTGTMLARDNFLNAVAGASRVMGSQSALVADLPAAPPQAAAALVAAIVRGDASLAAQAQLADYLAEPGASRAAGAYLAMAMPAYQLA